MASQGPNFPDSGATLANAGTSENAEAWVNPGNVIADDGSEAVITAPTYDSPDISQLLVASDFDFTIPAGSTIDGIIVEIDRRNSAGAASDNRVQLATGTTFADLVGDNKANTALDWPTATAVATYGSSTDNWNAGLTVDQINAIGFAVFLSVQADAANTDIQVDFIRVTVHYTAPAAQNILPSAIPSVEAVNTPSLILSPVQLIISAVDSVEAFGTPTLLAGSVSIIVTAIESAEVVGNPTLLAINTILPTAIPSDESVGTPSLILSVIQILPTSIVSDEGLGNPTLLATNIIIPGSVGSEEFVGIPTLIIEITGETISPSSITSGELFGLPTLIPGSVNIVPEGAASAESLGFPVLIPGQVSIIVGGITSAESVNQPVLVLAGAVTPGNWGKVNRTPTWSTTKRRGWNEAYDSLVKTRKNEGNK